jgi:indole-3-glycerol phosphate synthase
VTGERHAGVLGAIVAAARCAVAERRARLPLADLAARARDAAPPRAAAGVAFVHALTAGGPVRVIAECKRRSPSRGVLRADYDPVALARGYAAAGAVAISVLTEPAFFDGALAHLSAVTAAVGVPALRKDFVVDEYQVVEAAAAGAGAVLLIVAALDDAGLRGLLERADRWGLAALVEAHDAAEIARAVAAGARVIGVNNRDLRTLEVATATAEDLAARIPGECIAVAESGIRSGEDAARLAQRGYDAVLVGERFVTAPDPGAAVQRFIAEAEAALARASATLEAGPDGLGAQ